MVWHRSLTLALLAALAATPLCAQTPGNTAAAAANAAARPTPEEVCRALVDATVTVRVTVPVKLRATNGKTADTNAGGAIIVPQRTAYSVTVASGVSLGKGRIISFFSAPAAARIRVTLPEDGKSADAQVRVVDHYSGLTLLEIEDRDLPGLPLAAAAPEVGANVYTAAGSGAEQAVVSRGILGGKNRSVGSMLPAVMQCDVRTTSSSSGAAVVDDHSKLIGIVVATDAYTQRSGWTYTLPVQHVARLLKACPEQGVVVLERRRPVLGLNLTTGNQPQTVEVGRVIDNGPAAKAGIQVGDLLTELDGKKIRIVYQASAIALRKQPGETLDLTVERNGKPQQVQIVLGGTGAEPQPQPKLKDTQVIGVPRPFVGSSVAVSVPSVSIRAVSSATGASNVAAPKSDVDKLSTQVITLKSDLSARDKEITLLKSQLNGWAKALQMMQQRLKDRDEAQQKTQRIIKSLESELERLRKESAGKTSANTSSSTNKVQPGGE